MASAAIKRLRKRIQDLGIISKGLRAALLELELSPNDKEVFSRQEGLVVAELEDLKLTLKPLEEEFQKRKSARKIKEAENAVKRMDNEHQEKKLARIEASHKTSDFFKGIHEVQGGAPGSGKRS